jgi:phosphohistidine phosphatase
MSLFLVQHGKSLPKDVDPEKGLSEEGIKEESGLNPLDDVTTLAKTINHQDNLMLVGHLPFMERLTSHLIIGSSEKPVFKFQNGGIVCLDIEPDTQSWVIKWALMPNIG